MVSGNRCHAVSKNKGHGICKFSPDAWLLITIFNIPTFASTATIQYVRQVPPYPPCKPCDQSLLLIDFSTVLWLSTGRPLSSRSPLHSGSKFSLAGSNVLT